MADLAESIATLPGVREVRVDKGEVVASADRDAVPALMTTLFNGFARVHLTTHWAIPVWFALPVLMAVALLPRIGEAFHWRRLVPALAVCWSILLSGALIYTMVLSATGNPKYSLARQEMVRTIEARFAARFPAQQLSWAGGTWPEPGALAFFAAQHPRALPGFPDETRAQVNPFPVWPEKYGVILCFAADAYARIRETALSRDDVSAMRERQPDWLPHMPKW